MEKTSKAPSPTFLEALPSCPYTIKLSPRANLLVLTSVCGVLNHFPFTDHSFLIGRLFSTSPPI
jgi:hypothetical protein